MIEIVVFISFLHFSGRGSSPETPDIRTRANAHENGNGRGGAKRRSGGGAGGGGKPGGFGGGGPKRSGGGGGGYGR